jgi:GntR family transcriptional regulator
MRALSIDLAVNFNTVAFAYRELDREGMIATERGRGTFVASGLKPAELRRVRQKKLRELIEAMYKEADRLGYSADEVRLALEARTSRIQETE